VTEQVPRSHAESERTECFEFGLFSRGHWHQDLLLGYEIKTKKLSHNSLINFIFWSNLLGTIKIPFSVTEFAQHANNFRYQDDDQILDNGLRRGLFDGVCSGLDGIGTTPRIPCP